MTVRALPQVPRQEWLYSFTDNQLSGSFSLKEILTSSLYYPAAGFDGRPVQHLAGNIPSFVYVDYSKGKEALAEELEHRGFEGYHRVGQRSISEQELTPNGWSPELPRPEDGNPQEHLNPLVKPYCEWLVFERDADRGEHHGPDRFSLVYLCADGVAAFQALYVSNQCRPVGVAIIQPGQSFGGNWTNFEDERSPLARAVLRNPAGLPEIMLFGGIGKPEDYSQPCWDAFSDHVGFLEKTSIGVWRRTG